MAIVGVFNRSLKGKQCAGFGLRGKFLLEGMACGLFRGLCCWRLVTIWLKRVTPQANRDRLPLFSAYTVVLPAT